MAIMNVLFILDDALRPDHLGCYGYAKQTSPNIDRIAAEGLRFENVIASASHTLPPVISILTGLSSATHGVVCQKSFPKWLNNKYPAKSPIHLMEENGILVDGELVRRWHPLGFKRDTKGEDMEQYFADHRHDRWFFFAEPYPTHLPYNPPEENYKMFLDPGLTADEETANKLAIVKSRLIVHPSGKISKLQAGEQDALPDDDSDESHKRTFGIVDLTEKEKPFVLALYDGEVKVFDDMVGRWVKKLDELGILDETLIIITCDHGEELMERGHVGHCSCNLSGTLYDESIKVPLIMRLPEKLPAGRVIREQITQMDIMPTIFELLNLKLTIPHEGKSLMPLIAGQESNVRPYAFSETMPAGWQALNSDEREMWSVRTNEYKLIIKTTFFSDKFEYEFYDLTQDPGEVNNCYDANSSVCRHLSAKLIEYINWARSNRKDKI
jgi:arylsulfatase A-like enzyme